MIISREASKQASQPVRLLLGVTIGGPKGPKSATSMASRTRIYDCVGNQTPTVGQGLGARACLQNYQLCHSGPFQFGFFGFARVTHTITKNDDGSTTRDAVSIMACHGRCIDAIAAKHFLSQNFIFHIHFGSQSSRMMEAIGHAIVFHANGRIDLINAFIRQTQVTLRFS